MMRRHAAVAALAVLVVLLAVLGSPSRASAHGALRRSEPAAGAHLSTAPRVLRLTFNEAVQLPVSRLTLLGPGGAAVALSPLRRGDSATMLVADVVGPLVAGTYTVEWQIAGRDGHPVRDRFRFTIAPGAAGLASAMDAASATADSATALRAVPRAEAHDVTPPMGHHDPVSMPAGEEFGAESPLYAAVRWLGFAAVLLVVGALGFGLVVLPAAAQRSLAAAAARDRMAGPVAGVGMLGAVALLLAAGLRLLAQSVATYGSAGALDRGLLATMVGQTLWGGAWIVQVAAALLAAVGFALLRRHRAAGVTLGTIAVVAAALSMSLSGHAAAVPDRAPLAVAADAVHVLAAGGWLGTLLVLTVVGVPVALRAAPGVRGPVAAALVNAFSPLALVCAMAVALTGATAAWLHVGDMGALVSSTYGRTLLVKLGVLVPVAATGAYNWRRVRPSLADEHGARRLRRTAWVELAAGAIVLAVTAILVATPPPADLPPKHVPAMDGLP